MKQVHVIQMLMAVVIVLALGSCSSDVLSEVENQNGKQTVKLEFVGKSSASTNKVHPKLKFRQERPALHGKMETRFILHSIMALHLYQAKPPIAVLQAGRSAMMATWQQVVI